MSFFGSVLAVIIVIIMLVVCVYIFCFIVDHSTFLSKIINPCYVKMKELDDLVGEEYHFTPYFKNLLIKNGLSESYGKKIKEDVREFISCGNLPGINVNEIDLDAELKRYIGNQVSCNIAQEQMQEEQERNRRLEEARKFERKQNNQRSRNVSLSTKTKVLERDNYTCQMCGRNRYDGVKLEVDHIIPVSRGGSDNISNLQTLCFDCNRGKSDKILHNQ